MNHDASLFTTDPTTWSLTQLNEQISYLNQVREGVRDHRLFVQDHVSKNLVELPEEMFVVPFADQVREGVTYVEHNHHGSTLVAAGLVESWLTSDDNRIVSVRIVVKDLPLDVRLNRLDFIKLTVAVGDTIGLVIQGGHWFFVHVPQKKEFTEPFTQEVVVPVNQLVDLGSTKGTAQRFTEVTLIGIQYLDGSETEMAHGFPFKLDEQHVMGDGRNDYKALILSCVGELLIEPISKTIGSVRLRIKVA